MSSLPWEATVREGEGGRRGWASCYRLVIGSANKRKQAVRLLIGSAHQLTLTLTTQLLIGSMNPLTFLHEWHCWQVITLLYTWVFYISWLIWVLLNSGRWNKIASTYKGGLQGQTKLPLHIIHCIWIPMQYEDRLSSKTFMSKFLSLCQLTNLFEIRRLVSKLVQDCAKNHLTSK